MRVCGVPSIPNQGFLGPLGATCAGCWGVPGPLCWWEGGPILLCIVLLSLLFFLSVAWRVCYPRSHPVEGLGVNKADGRGLWRSLHGLASPLSSVSHLCGQASQGHRGQGQAPRVPLMSLCTSLCAQPPSAWVVIFYLKGETLFPQAHARVWVVLSGVISPPLTPWVFPSADKACLELCKTLWARRGRIPHPPRCQPDGSYCE